MVYYKILILFYLSIIGWNAIASAQSTNVHSTNEQNTNTIMNLNDPDVIFNKGLKELQKGNIIKAINLLEKLFFYKTENPDYYIYLGYLYYVQGNYDKAVEVLNKSLEFNQMLPAPHILLGEIYYQLNSILKARNEFEKVLQIDQDIKLAHVRLYELFKNNNPVKADEHYLRIFHLPTTKLEKYLPDMEKIGNITLPFNKNVLVLKDIMINKNLKKNEKILDKILEDAGVRSNKENIIVSVKDRDFNFNFNFNALLNPVKKIDKEKLNIKIIELVFVSIFLFIYSFFVRKKEKMMERIVLSQYRISTIKKE